MPNYQRAILALNKEIDRNDVRRFDAAVTVRQIGGANYLASCGGKSCVMHDGQGDTYALVMHTGSTYWITVTLNFLDYYTVQRWRILKGKAQMIWEADNLDFTQVGAGVYAASCFEHSPDETDAIFAHNV